MTDSTFTFFANCPVGWESMLVDEATELGMHNIQGGHAGIYFDANHENLYRYILWARLANKVFLPIKSAKVSDAQSIYDAAHDIDWPAFFAPTSSLRVDFTGTNNEIRNTQFGAQKVKDAIVDKLTYLGFERPVVDKTQPDIRINVRLVKDEVTWSLDLCGESLHKRGYRTGQGSAPLKENLAAAILVRAGLPKAIKEHDAFTVLDPMCGSGTFLIEAAMMVLNIAPSLTRETFSFDFWTQHNATLWQDVKAQAQAQKERALASEKAENWCFVGYDENPYIIKSAENNIVAAGLEDMIRLKAQSADALVKPVYATDHGLIITNPPYGERLGEVEALKHTYFALAETIKQHFENWVFGLFTSNLVLASETRMRASKKNKFRNGPLHAEILLYNIRPAAQAQLRDGQSSDAKPEKILKDLPLSDDAQMVLNRLNKNRKRLKKVIKSESLHGYRVYDADIPEYACAVDVYNDKLHIQEYAPPKTIDEKKALHRFEQLKHAVAVCFDADNDVIFTKTRRKNKGALQYENQTSQTGFDKNRCFTLTEGQAQFLINLDDYLDTGLFLDHRPLRQTIAQQAKGKRFLNLFCYTASATVHAALGGAVSSTSVDMSNTYLDWAEENFRLNNLNPREHQLERADCLGWLDDCRDEFDLIMLDPPTFSNSKKMDDVLDIQRDHIALISQSMRILSEQGVLYFSTNFRKFKLDADLAAQFTIENISTSTIGDDFKQNPKIHYCWRITHKR